MITITPSLAAEYTLKGKPAYLTISKSSVVFNNVATKLLALKEGCKFLIIEKSKTLYYLEVVAANQEGFIISSTPKNCAKLTPKGLYMALQDIYRGTNKAFKFEIGPLLEGGSRRLTDIQVKK